MTKQQKGKKEIIKHVPRFPVNIQMTGDDFNFEIEIDMEMAGKIIQYIGSERERIAKKYHHDQ